GCGLGQDEKVWQQIKALYAPEKPTVWDADALNLLAKDPFRLGEKAVITPHIGEAARLLGRSTEEILKDRLEAAKELCEKFGCTVVLKSDVTVICCMEEGKPEYILNASGSPAMAKGGSGDVLAGMLGALLHEEMLPLQAAGLACLWHGMAGEAGEKKYGLLELTAEKLIECFYEARKEK
ncbi:MAG: NAD(P)H-hydrate dehydratase, partial [Clostridia bacterium]|nr:NAD(P)H-hydrate dehydratase [Clostridia bacterium]